VDIESFPVLERQQLGKGRLTVEKITGKTKKSGEDIGDKRGELL
jgi:hypothetical protein